MKKINLTNRFRANRGSALLITVLLMGLLMTLALGISNLVIREIRVTTSIVSANQAYYGAEAGVEEALLGISRGGPGVEPSSNNQQFDLDASGIKYDYKTDNQSTRIPDFPTDRPIFVQPSQVANAQGGIDVDCQLTTSKNEFAIPKYNDPQNTNNNIYVDCPRATFKKLALNQTDIVPLFSTDAKGNTVDVSDFMVEYYMNIANGQNFYGPFQGLPLEQFDVLRWKLYGKPSQGSQSNKTESIADIYPAITNNGPTTPVCIGTDVNLTTEAKEQCIFPTLSPSNPDVQSNDPNQATSLTLWSAARECYQSDAGSYVTNNQPIKGTQLGTQNAANYYGVCNMKDFLASHTQNYLVLTNLVNPNVVGITNINDPEQLARADIYYRVIVPSDSSGGSSAAAGKLPRDFAEIVANGYSANGSVVKTLQVNYQKPGFLPVFNFSLYATQQGGTNP